MLILCIFWQRQRPGARPVEIPSSRKQEKTCWTVTYAPETPGGGWGYSLYDLYREVPLFLRLPTRVGLCSTQREIDRTNGKLRQYEVAEIGL
jgi:hypothetical protein